MTINWRPGDANTRGALIRARGVPAQPERPAVVRDVMAVADAPGALPLRSPVRRSQSVLDAPSRRDRQQVNSYVQRLGCDSNSKTHEFVNFSARYRRLPISPIGQNSGNL